MYGGVLAAPGDRTIGRRPGQPRVSSLESTEDKVKRRPTENAKIDAATKHFAAIGVDDYAVSTPTNWRV